MTTDFADDDLPTLAAIGVAAAMLAALAHEVVGHGLGCLAAGGQVTTVSTIIFRCEGGDALTDLGGPLGSLALGLLALCIIASRRVVYREGRLFALIVAGLALFWFFAQLLFAAFRPHDDWAYAATAAGWSPTWRAAAVATAVVGYDVTRRAMTRAMRTLSTGRSAAADRRRFLTPWLAGLVAMVLAAALYPVARLTSMTWAVQALGGAPLGLVLAVVVASRLGATGPDSPKPIRRRWWWIAAVSLAYILYCLTMGLGVSQPAEPYSGMSAKLEP